MESTDRLTWFLLDFELYQHCLLEHFDGYFGSEFLPTLSFPPSQDLRLLLVLVKELNV